jgi:hypothetical protein
MGLFSTGGYGARGSEVLGRHSVPLLTGRNDSYLIMLSHAREKCSTAEIIRHNKIALTREPSQCEWAGARDERVNYTMN